jgi:hypothetical protein
LVCDPPVRDMLAGRVEAEHILAGFSQNGAPQQSAPFQRFRQGRSHCGDLAITFEPAYATHSAISREFSTLQTHFLREIE